jgi:hypothetical protein
MAFGMWAVLERRADKRLKLPDYSHNTGDVYRDFTVHLANIPNSMDFLLYAAARNYPGQPSWVPDLTASEKHIWASKVGEIRAPDDYGNAVEHHTKSVLSSRIIINPMGFVINVSAYNVATISMCVKAQKTSSVVRDIERNIRLENIRYIHFCAAIQQVLKWHIVLLFVNITLFPPSIIFILPVAVWEFLYGGVAAIVLQRFSLSWRGRIICRSKAITLVSTS